MTQFKIAPFAEKSFYIEVASILNMAKKLEVAGIYLDFKNDGIFLIRSNGVDLENIFYNARELRAYWLSGQLSHDHPGALEQ